MYNPKPSYKEVMESVSQLFVWVFAKDETFDDTGYRMIAESKVRHSTTFHCSTPQSSVLVATA